MQVTIEQLPSFLQANFPNCQRFTPQTELRDQSIDGDDAVELLECMVPEDNGLLFKPPSATSTELGNKITGLELGAPGPSNYSLCPAGR